MPPPPTGLLPPWPAPSGDRLAELSRMRSSIADFFERAEVVVRARHHADRLAERALRLLDRSGRIEARIVADPKMSERAAIFRRVLRENAERRIRRRATEHAKKKFKLDRMTGPAPRLQLTAPAGAGKTSAVAAALLARPWLCKNAVVWIAEPSLGMGAQVQADLKVLGIEATLIRGRGAAHPLDPDQAKPTRRMCARHEVAAKVGNCGISVQHALCGTDEEGPQCPFRRECETDGYQSQRAGGAGIYILAHQYLGIAAAPAPRPDVVVVDERHWQTLTHIDQGLHPDRLRHQPEGLSRLGRSDEAISRYMQIAGTVGDALRASGGRRILAHLRDADLKAADLDFCASLLADLETSDETGVSPAMSDEAVAAHLRGLERSEIAAMKRLFRALDEEIALQRDEANGVVFEPSASLEVEGRPERQERVYVRRLRSAKIAEETPVLVIDASADIDINRRIWGPHLEDAGVRIERHARVVQLTRKVFPRSVLLGFARHGEDAAKSAKRAAEADRERRQLAAFAAEAARQAGGSALLVSYLAAEEDLLELLDGEPVAVAHFGAVRGRNDWKDCAAVIVAGREQPGPAAIEAYARALYADDAEPFLTLGQYVKQTRAMRVRGGGVHCEVVQVHPDPRCQRVLEQLREREIEQAIDRARLIHNAEPKLVFLLTNIPCDITVDRVMSWADLRNGGSRLERAFARAGGVMPLSATELARVFPDLWRSAKAAEHDLFRTGKNTPEAQIDTLFAGRGYFRVRYRRPGQRGKASPAVVAAGKGDPAAALAALVGPVEVEIAASPDETAACSGEAAVKAAA